MGLLRIRTLIQVQVLKGIPTYPSTREYLDLGHIDTSASIEGYPRSWDCLNLGHIDTSPSIYQRISQHILGHGTT